MEKSRRLRDLAGGAAPWAVLSYLFKSPWLLLENGLLGLGDDQIAKWAQPMMPALGTAFTAAVAWGPPITAAALCVAGVFYLGTQQSRTVTVKAVGRDAATTPATSPQVVIEWLSIGEAVERFADQSLVHEKNAAQEKFERRYVEVQETRDRMQLLVGEENANEKQRLIRLSGAQSMVSRTDQEQLKELWKKLHADLVARLSSGELISKGFAFPYVAGKPEIFIPASEWRVMIPDQGENNTVRKDDPMTVVYAGVVIGKER